MKNKRNPINSSALVMIAIIKEKTSCYTTYERQLMKTSPCHPPLKKAEKDSSCCSAQNDCLAAVYLQDKHFPLTC